MRGLASRDRMHTAQSFDESRIRSSKPQEDLVEDLQKENVLAFEY